MGLVLTGNPVLLEAKTSSHVFLMGVPEERQEGMCTLVGYFYLFCSLCKINISLETWQGRSKGEKYGVIAKGKSIWSFVFTVETCNTKADYITFKLCSEGIF